MGATIDHLAADLRVHVLQDFRDARGALHRAGERAVIRTIKIQWGAYEIEIEWEREGVTEKLVFALRAKDGPRNGRMRDYFEDEGRWSPPRPDPAIETRRRIATISAPAPEPVTEPDCYPDAWTRIEALIVRHRFDEAEQQLRLVLDHPDPHGGRLMQLADGLIDLAVAYAPGDRAIYDWAGNRGVSLWYAWGSGATSGGEGAARRLEIDKAEERLARHAPRDV